MSLLLEARKYLPLASTEGSIFKVLLNIGNGKKATDDSLKGDPAIVFFGFIRMSDQWFFLGKAVTL